MQLATSAIHAGFHGDPETGSCTVPIHQTTAYLYKNTEHASKLFKLEEFGWIYTRLQNPTTDVFEQRMAALDGGVGAVAFSSGQQAIFVAIANLVHSGEHFIASSSLYGGTVCLFKNTMKRLGISVTFVDMKNKADLEAAFRPETRAVYYEAVANPKNEILDYESIAEIAHKNGVPVICDNTVLTPVLFRPIEHGADIVIYSATKMVGGHANSMGGVIVDSGKFDWNDRPEMWPQFQLPDPSYHGKIFAKAFGNLCYIITCRTHWLRDLGGCISPTNSFLMIQGLETLSLRAPKHSENALALAQFLEQHPLVNWVNYPGLSSHPDHKLAQKYMPKGTGCVIGFGIKGGRESGKKFIESVKMAYHLANICDVRTLVIHPATTTHSQLSDSELTAAGISDDFIRISVGLEDISDIIADINQALAATAN
ncbi:MAG: O-acetylhomoserine aminocarboxypropyltransferase/cysteine synthase family protein [Thermoguttaceae bacterium]